jgi:hypothetical protein
MKDEDTEVKAEEYDETTETVYPEPEPVTVSYYTNDLLNAIRLDVGSIAHVITELKWWLDLLMYAVLGACIGWAIGSLLM